MENRRWLALGGVISATCLGVALQLSNGILVPRALALVVLAFVLSAAAAALPRPAHLLRLDAPAVRFVGLAALAIHLMYFFTSPPALYVQFDAEGLRRFHAGLAVLAIAGASAAWPSPRWAKLQILVLIAAHAALGAWIIQRSPYPPIDVHTFHRYAIYALRDGIDPYAITFPDIYRSGAYYGPGLSVAGRLQFGFPGLSAQPAAVLARAGVLQRRALRAADRDRARRAVHDVRAAARPWVDGRGALPHDAAHLLRPGAVVDRAVPGARCMRSRLCSMPPQSPDAMAVRRIYRVETVPWSSRCRRHGCWSSRRATGGSC